MSVKVKRGLGLLVVAAIAFLLLLPLTQASPSGDAASALLAGGTIAAGVALLGGLVGGLALLAWGLLRD